MGHSPAPVYRVLPNLYPVVTSIPETLPGQHETLQLDHTGYTAQTQIEEAPAQFVQYRYRQTEEERLRQELSVLAIQHGNDDHPDTLRILSELSEVLISQGRYSSAEEMIRRLVKLSEEKRLAM